MRTLILIWLLSTCFQTTSAQEKGEPVPFYEHPIYETYKGIKQGEKDSLLAISRYLHSTRPLTRRRGIHEYIQSEHEAALEILHKQTRFLHHECELNYYISGSDFASFWSNNKEEIRFDSLAKVFFITTLAARETRFELLPLTVDKKSQLKKGTQLTLDREWAQAMHIKERIIARDPEVLYTLARLSMRSPQSNPWFHPNACINLLHYLTHTRLVVPDGRDSMMYREDYLAYRDRTFYTNVAIFFGSHYQQYVWDIKRNCFVLPGHYPESASKVEALFEEMIFLGPFPKSKVKKSYNAFLRLSEEDPVIVGEMALQRLPDGMGAMHLPHAFKHLSALANMTAYWREHSISYKNSPRFRRLLSKLRSEDLSFRERYKLENRLLTKLDFNNIHTFEYWALAYSDNGVLNHSALRILNIFYSGNWKRLIHKPVHLASYLKFASLFSDWRYRYGTDYEPPLYLVKFIGREDAILPLEKLSGGDEDVNKAKTDALELCKISEPRRNTPNAPDSTHIPINFTQSFYQLTNNATDSSRTESSLGKLLFSIHYHQLDTAISLIEPYPFEYRWKKFEFLHDNLGIPISYIEAASKESEALLSNYHRLPKKAFYLHYLQEIGVGCQQKDGSLDLQKIYSMLKYDLKYNSNSSAHLHIASLFRLLEMKFDTRLGFPSSICENSWGTCDIFDRNLAWQHYLVENHHVVDTEPASFWVDLPEK